MGEVLTVKKTAYPPEQTVVKMRHVLALRTLGG
jgi:hypothetical protein